MRRILASLVMVLFAAQVASADLIVVLEEVTVDYSADAQQGSFEVYVTSDLSPAPKLVGYQMELLSDDPRITFVGYDKPASRPTSPTEAANLISPPGSSSRSQYASQILARLGKRVAPLIPTRRSTREGVASRYSSPSICSPSSPRAGRRTAGGRSPQPCGWSPFCLSRSPA